MPGVNLLGVCTLPVEAAAKFTAVTFSVTAHGSSSFTADHGSGSASFSDSHTDSYTREPYVNGSTPGANKVQIVQGNCCCRAQWSIVSGSPTLSDCAYSATYSSSCSGFITESKTATIAGFAEIVTDTTGNGFWGMDPPFDPGTTPLPCKKDSGGGTLPPGSGAPYLTIAFSGLSITGPTASAPAMSFTGTSVMSAPGASDVTLGYPNTNGQINVPIDVFANSIDVVVTIQLDATGSGNDIGWGNATGTISWTIVIELSLS